MIALLALSAFNVAHAQDCSTQITSQALDNNLDSVAMGFVEMDLEKVKSGLESIQQNTPCLTEGIESEVAHDYHMLNGLYNYFMGDQESAQNSLRLAKRLAPDKSIPTHLFDDGHEIHTLYAGLEYIELDSEVPVSSRGVYVFNGQTINRPVGTQSIVQIKEGSSIILSAIVEANEALPTAPTIPTVAESTATKTPDTVTDPVEVTTKTNTAQQEKTPQENNNTVSTADISKESDFPWIWTGGVAASSVGYAVTYSQFCGGFDTLYCEQAQQDTRSLQIANYAFLGIGAFSAYKMTRGLKSSAE